MGTRHLIAIYVDGEPKIANYGQWDGYPEGQGAALVEFLQDADFEALAQQARKVRRLTAEEAAAEWEAGNRMPLSRSTGSDILEYLRDTPDPITGPTALGFAADSLFCEWAYVIDLDAMIFEVYRGFQEKPHTDGRFADMKSGDHGWSATDGYYPVRLLATFNIRDIPADWIGRLGEAV